MFIQPSCLPTGRGRTRDTDLCVKPSAQPGLPVSAWAVKFVTARVHGDQIAPAATSTRQK